MSPIVTKRKRRSKATLLIEISWEGKDRAPTAGLIMTILEVHPELCAKGWKISRWGWVDTKKRTRFNK